MVQAGGRSNPSASPLLSLQIQCKDACICVSFLLAIPSCVRQITHDDELAGGGERSRSNTSLFPPSCPAAVKSVLMTTHSHQAVHHPPFFLFTSLAFFPTHPTHPHAHTTSDELRPTCSHILAAAARVSVSLLLRYPCTPCTVFPSSFSSPSTPQQPGLALCVWGGGGREGGKERGSATCIRGGMASKQKACIFCLVSRRAAVPGTISTKPHALEKEIACRAGRAQIYGGVGEGEGLALFGSSIH